MDLQVARPMGNQVDILYRFIESNPQGVTQQDLVASGQWPDQTVIIHAAQRLLNEGRISVTQLGAGKLLYQASDPSMAQKFAGLDAQHMLVYQLVEKAGNKGEWSKRLKDQTNLQQHTITRIVKGLIQRQLIKEVKSMQNRKVFMLFDVEPAREVSGGTFYRDGAFASGWLESLRERCLAFLESDENQRVVTLSEIFHHVIQHPSGPSVPTEEDVASIMRTLELDEIIYSVQTATGEIHYAHRNSGRNVQAGPFDLFAARLPNHVTKSHSEPPNLVVPCFTCPLQMQCSIGGRISPDKCEYISAWLKEVTDRDPNKDRGLPKDDLMQANDW